MRYMPKGVWRNLQISHPKLTHENSRNRRSGLYRKTQFDYEVVGHTAGPHKSFVARILRICLSSYDPSCQNLAVVNLVVNLSIAVPSIANLSFLIPQL
jgi:hypothetical protein